MTDAIAGGPDDRPPATSAPDPAPASRPPRDALRRAAVVASWVALAAVIAGYFFKGQCLHADGGRQLYERLCYSDLPPLYGLRGVADHVFPYVNGRLEAGELVGGAIEYPVLTGVFMWLSGLLATTVEQYFVISALLMAPVAVFTAYLLGRMTGWRALTWAAAPALVLYAFHNWDLLVVGAAVIGVWCWHRREHGAAGAWFGIAASFKLYPILFLAPLFFDVLRAHGRRRAAAAFGAGVGAFALVNAPFFVANPSGWWATYEFHRLRGPNIDNVWNLWFPSETWLGSYPSLTPAMLNLVTALLTGTLFVVALVAGWRRARREGVYPFLQVCAAMLAAFLLWNKVHSPQFTLWILPFFALVRVNVLWWLAYVVVDAATYYGVFQWYYDVSQGGDFGTAKKLMIGGVWARAALLLVMFVVFLRARAAPPPAVPAGDREPRDPEPAAGGARVAAPA